jgi:coproporphyrinogen III oxidase
VNLAAVETYLLGLQQNIVSALEVAGNQSFLRDEWIRAEGGGGISRLIEGGDLFERAGVIFSHVKVKTLTPSETAHRP